MSCHCPFRLATFAAAAFALLAQASMLPVHAQVAQAGQQTAQQAALSDNAKAAPARPQASPTTSGSPTTGAAGTGNVAAVDPANTANPAQKGLAGRAIDKVKEVAKSATDIFSRVPCLSPKGVSKSMGSLPHVANKLAAGEPVVIVAFGSS